MNESLLNRFFDYLKKKEDSHSLAIFRIGFGVIMMIEVLRFYFYGFIENLFAKQDFHFKYTFFHWVEAPTGDNVYLIFLTIFISAFCVAIGLFYQIATIILFITYTYFFLIDEAYYNNHFYLIVIFSLLIIFVPLGKFWSLDCYLRKVPHKKKIENFWLWIMRTPMTLVYVFGGIAKFDQDWIDGTAPKLLFTKANQGTPLELLMQNEWIPHFYAWSGMLFDLFVPFAILYKKTRWWAFAAACIFHINNAFVFNIGIFPYLALFLTLLYLQPDYPKRFFSTNWKLYISNIYSKKIVYEKDCDLETFTNKFCISVIVILFTFQLILPLRHYLYPGRTTWHQEGHKFSWRMMLSEKKAEYIFNVYHPKTGEKRYIELEQFLNSVQIKAMVSRPNLILEFVHMLNNIIIKNVNFDPIVTANIRMSLNDSEYQYFFSPEKDLSLIPKDTPAYLWIYPLRK